MPVRAVLFDVGGPLDTEVEHERLIDLAIREAVVNQDYPVTDQMYAAANEYAVQSFAWNAYAAIIWRLCQHDAKAAEAAYAEVARGSAARAAARGGFEPRTGVAAMLQRLHEAGLKLGLAANQPLRVLDDLDALGLGKFFSHREVSGRHGYLKPDVRLFLRACEDLGVAPEDCIMVGDRIDNDIAPARMLGMKTVLFRTGRHIGQHPRSVDEVPDYVARTVEEMEAAIRRLAELPA